MEEGAGGEILRNHFKVIFFARRGRKANLIYLFLILHENWIVETFWSSESGRSNFAKKSFLNSLSLSFFLIMIEKHQKQEQTCLFLSLLRI